MLLLGLGFVTLAVLGFVLLQRPSEPPVAADAPPGRLVATQAEVDLGRVPFDKMVEARYELSNTGGRSMRLLGVPTVKTIEGC